ncbi:hypothetical protein FRC05_008637 [Tulasnella sp. 425]|nr:hypothetical protein FRC05_008637 [Tulasnella sp. 425]
MPRNTELVIDVAQRIRDILDDYPAGPSILREILQNTDDAGGRVQRFILDTRKHPSEGLFDPILKDCQGPAIIACNDSNFQPQDWRAICSISNSSKKGDERSTGKFGLGFCTSYHVTDYPHVLSGDQLIILDPHKNIKDSTGCINFSTRRSPSETDRDTFPAHFGAFKGILKPQDDVFDGTAIRLPLRLPDSKSRINPTPMSVEAAREIFEIFVKEDLPEVMLFLKHITAIEVIEISPDGKETLWAAARIENAEEIVKERSKTRGRSPDTDTSHYKLRLTETYTSDSESNVKTRDWIITHYVDSFKIASSAMAKRLDRIGDLEGVEESMASDKLFPHVALAFPLLDKTAIPKPSFSGRLFTLLPLPIFTHFPLHIHATLALTSSRQNLRNAQETVTDPRSRLRVEWNRVIFSRFVPEAWVALMKHLVSKLPEIDVFDTWPSAASIRDDGHGYWPSLPHVLLKEAAVQNVWPLRSDPSSHKQLTDVLVTPRNREPRLLDALESCKVPIVVIPSNVLDTIFPSVEFKDRILGPAAAVSFLRGNSKTLSQLEKATVKTICDYLVWSKDINLIFKLPIIPNVAGGHTSISPDATYILAKGPEAKVFQPVAPDLLAADAMSPETLQLLLEKSNGKVHYLGSKEVATYLKKRVGLYGGPRIPTVFTGVNASVSEWLVGFWAWMDKWDKFDALVADKEQWDAVQALHALPLHTPNRRPALRQVKGSAIHPAQTDADVLSALVSLEVPVLLSSITDGRRIRMVSKKPTDVEFILQNLPKTTKSFQNLTQSSRKALHDFLSDQLSHLIASSRNKSASVLDSTCQNALRTLPIFPLLHPGERSAESLSFDVAPEGFRFVSKSVHVIPNIKGIAFFDFEQGMSLCRALGAEAIDEITVLEMTIEPGAWRHLHAELVPNIIGRLIHHLSDFKDATRQKISELEIVDVDPSGKRKSPKSVIDPLSPLAGLFDPEDEILPVGEFAKEGQGSYLQHLRNHHMMQTALTDEILEERIDYIVTTSEGSDPDMAVKKALRLLSLLDKRSKEHSLTYMSPRLVDLLRQKAWIPVGGEFYQSSDCWDSRAMDTLLCDWVLPHVPIEVGSSSLRMCLGWDAVSFDVLRRQMLALMDACPECQVSATEDISDRIKAVLRTLASRLSDGTCSQDELESLADELGDAEWVPISEGRRIKAQRSWLPSDQLERDLGSRFFPVVASLLKEEGIRDLLTLMRLPERPSTADLHAGQLEISEELSQPDLDSRLREGLIRASIDLALEICRDRDPSEVRQLPLLVPTESGTLVDAENVLYNDMELDPQRLQDGIQFTHKLMSQAHAKDLGLRTYRERQLTQLESADDKDGFYIGEDVTARIKSVLLDYDIDHSINEWVANAADAGASVLKLLVDEATFEGGQCVPTTQEFPAGPALVIHNDAVFSEEDFQGIGHIGTGGKSNKSNSIGRFGLGALSFYHFTELPMVISGSYVLLLDPSRQYLPLQRSRGIRLTLGICCQNWPDQLKPLEGVFGFFAEKGHYKGTLFRLPLRTVGQADSSSLSKKHVTTVDVFDIIRRFYTSASRSLFFTPLHEISAERRTPDLVLSSIWHTTASRKMVRQDEGFNSFAASEVSVHQRNSEDNVVSQRWLVTTSTTSHKAFPPEFEALIDKHRLLNRQPNFGLALNLSTEEYTLKSALFAYLPLPVSIALPVHLHATWILAPDRRSIRNDASIQGSDPPLDSKYNRYIMQNFIPALYLQTLELLNEEYPAAIKLAWPRRSDADGEAIVATELYRQLPSVRRLVLRTVKDVRTSPRDVIIHFNRNPKAVQKIVASLPVPNYVSEPHFDTDFFKDWRTLHDDSPTRVATLLREHVVEVRDLCHGDSPQITISDIEDILKYFLEANQSLVGIPLLPLGDGRVIAFRSRYSGSTVFGSRLDVVEKFFGKSHAVHSKLSSSLAEKISDYHYRLNVRTFSYVYLKEFFKEFDERITPMGRKQVGKDRFQWHRDFLAFLVQEWQGSAVEHLDDLPLIPTENGDLVVSLEYAKGRRVWRKHSWESQCLSRVFLQLQVPVVNVRLLPETLLPAREANAPQQLFEVVEILQQVPTVFASISERVKQDDWTEFATTLRSWIRSDSLYRVFAKPELIDILVNLPLFQGWQGSTPLAHVPSSKLVMLPVMEDLALIAQFLPSDKIFAPQSPELEALLKRHGRDRILPLNRFFEYLELPGSQIQESLYLPLRAIINSVINNHKGPYHRPLIPDGEGVLKKPGDLYDHRVEAYALRFEGRPDLFVHPAFRDMIDGMQNLGVRHKFNPQELLDLIHLVDREARGGGEVMTRAEWVWNYINGYPLGMGAVGYDQIRGMRFIPRSHQKYQLDSVLPQCVPDLPVVVSPDELYLDENAAILWTQRAPFASPPTPALSRVYPELGRPTAEHVVQHLVKLTNAVATKNTKSNNLLQDIQGIYDWLKRNQREAQWLLRSVSSCPIWLNIDSEDDPWVWRAAHQLVFDLPHDGKGYYRAKEFLNEYNALVMAAGAKRRRFVAVSSRQNEVSHLERIFAGWRALRNKGMFFDICFKVEGCVIGAHLGMMAAVVPHFATALGGGSRTAEVVEYPLPGGTSAFAATGVVDYVYEGSFVRPTPTTTEDAALALDHLLDLLRLADTWEIADLKGQVVDCISELKLVDEENCDFTMAKAENYNSEALAQYCMKTKEINGWK